MKLRKHVAPAAVIATLAAVALVGCDSKYTEPFKDAPRSGNDNRAPMDVIEMSDGFSNVGAKCDGPNRVYVVFHNDNAYGSIAVVPNDPRCTSR